MGYYFEFDEGNNTLRIVWDGRVTDRVFCEGVAAVRTFLVSHEGSRGVVDFSNVAMNVTRETVEGLATLPPSGEEGSSLVVIVAPRDIVFEWSRVFAALASKSRPNRHVVRTMEEAYELLGIKEPKFKRITVT